MKKVCREIPHQKMPGTGTGEIDMNKNDFAKTPPMGWNSYDYYDTAVNEEQVKANADYMAAHLKEYGWE